MTAHIANLLKKYNVDVQDVFAGHQRFRAKLEAEVLPEGLSLRFAEGEKNLQDLFERLREPLAKLDQSLVGALDTAAKKMLYQFSSLRAKAGRAEGFRTGVLDTHEREITSLLLPNGKLQERTLSLLPFWPRRAGNCSINSIATSRLGRATIAPFIYKNAMTQRLESPLCFFRSIAPREDLLYARAW